MPPYFNTDLLVCFEILRPPLCAGQLVCQRLQPIPLKTTIFLKKFSTRCKHAKLSYKTQTQLGHFIIKNKIIGLLSQCQLNLIHSDSLETKIIIIIIKSKTQQSNSFSTLTFGWFETRQCSQTFTRCSKQNCVVTFFLGHLHNPMIIPL